MNQQIIGADAWANGARTMTATEPLRQKIRQDTQRYFESGKTIQIIPRGISGLKPMDPKKFSVSKRGEALYERERHG